MKEGFRYSSDRNTAMADCRGAADDAPGARSRVSKLPSGSEASGLIRSNELLARARKLIPGASQTMSKGPTQWAQGVAPTFLARGRGARVQDVDGRWYLDFPMALGPVILGTGTRPSMTPSVLSSRMDHLHAAPPTGGRGG